MNKLAHTLSYYLPVVDMPDASHNPPGRKWILLISCVLFLVVGYHVWTQVLATGDQVHYLIMTQSLIDDFDLEIENNYQTENYRDFFAFDIDDQAKFDDMHVKPVKRGYKTFLYSIHSWGVPLLIAPAYLLFGWPATVVTIIFITTLTSLGIYVTAYKMTGKVHIAIIVWLTMAFSLPLLAMSSQIYPDIIASAILIWSFLLLLNYRGQSGQGLALGGLIGYLPLLHPRYLAPTFLFLAILVFIAWQNRLSWRTLLAPFLVSLSLLAVQMTLSYVQFGSFALTAAYDGTDHSIAAADWAGFPRRCVFWLVDQELGLFPYAPLYILAIVGFLQMLRHSDRRWLALVALVLFASVHLPPCMIEYYFLGYYFPARFLSAVVPLLAAPLAYLLSARHRILNYTFYLLSILSVCLALYGVSRPALLLNSGSGRGQIFRKLGRTYIDLTLYLPSAVSQSYKEIIPGESYRKRLSLAADSPRLLKLTYFDFPDKNLRILIDGQLAGEITGGTSATWKTYEVAVPSSAGDKVPVTLVGAGTDVIGVSKIWLEYISAEVKFEDISITGTNSEKYANITPGKSYRGWLALDADGPRRVRLTYFDFPGEDLRLLIDGQLAGEITGNASTSWKTYEALVPFSAADAVSFTLTATGAEAAAVSKIRLEYISAEVKFKDVTDADWTTQSYKDIAPGKSYQGWLLLAGGPRRLGLTYFDFPGKDLRILIDGQLAGEIIGGTSAIWKIYTVTVPPSSEDVILYTLENPGHEHSGVSKIWLEYTQE